VNPAEADREVHVVFWYELNGRVTAEPPPAKAYTVLRLLAGRRPLARLVAITGESRADRGGDAELVARLACDLLQGAAA
jgi:hypothetical protein